MKIDQPEKVYDLTLIDHRDSCWKYDKVFETLEQAELYRMETVGCMRIKVGGEDDGGEPPIPCELFNVHIGVRYVNLFFNCNLSSHTHSTR